MMISHGVHCIMWQLRPSSHLLNSELCDLFHIWLKFNVIYVIPEILSLTNNVFCESAWACLIEYWIKCNYHVYTKKNRWAQVTYGKRGHELWQHWLWESLQCCQTTPSHYLTQCWLGTHFTNRLVVTQGTIEMSNWRLSVHLSITRLSQ